MVRSGNLQKPISKNVGRKIRRQGTFSGGWWANFLQKQSSISPRLATHDHTSSVNVDAIPYWMGWVNAINCSNVVSAGSAVAYLRCTDDSSLNVTTTSVPSTCLILSNLAMSVRFCRQNIFSV